MKKWAEEYSHICRLESIGKSIEDRDIWALKLSDNPELDEPEPAALIMGMHHSREWPSVEVPMATIKLLLEEYGHNEKFTELVNSREIWFVPIVNPDGFIYSQEQSRYWRKNRRKNSGGTYGVDLNRNYGYQWGNVGASSSGYSDTYHGTGPFSEPESQAIRDFALRERFQASISFHTYSELILFPFGYGYNVPNPDRKVFEKMASDMAEFNKYRPQNSAELYPAMGDCDDYLYGELKVLSFTFELCRTFIPSASQIDQVNSLNVPAVLYLIEKAGTYGLISPSGDDEIVENLEFNDALAALTDIVMLFDRENNIAMRNEVLNRIERLSLKTAQLVVDDLNKGKTDSWELLKEVNQAALASSYVRNRVLFNQAHGQKYSEYILNEFKK
jgi:carboxypeptidase T